MNRHDVILFLGLFAVIGSAGILSFLGQYDVSGMATTATSTSSAIISAYLSIASSNNLSSGISFGTISAIPSGDVNATGNAYNSTGNFAGDASGYNISVSSDSNVAVDFCIKADSQFNTTANDTIPLTNYTYTWSSASNGTFPKNGTNGTAITTSYVKTNTSIAAGGNEFYRFFLDVPPAQAAGTYDNTISFEGVQTTTSC